MHLKLSQNGHSITFISIICVTTINIHIFIDADYERITMHILFSIHCLTIITFDDIYSSVILMLL